MITIRNYTEWMQRVRILDPACQALSAFYRKVLSSSVTEVEEGATELERQLFLPPNPKYGIQPFENASGQLVCDVGIESFTEFAERLGFVKDHEYIQGGMTRVLGYTLSGPLATLYIAENARKPDPRRVKFLDDHGKLRTFDFQNHSGLWICAYDSNRFRTSHDWARPFLELVDERKIPSVIVDREDRVGATNIPPELWEFSARV